MGEMDDLLDAYAYELGIFLSGYNMMGKLLDKNLIKSRVEMAGLSEVYIYGGGYLGIQLYNAITPFVKVLNVVDRSGKLLVEVPGIPVIRLDVFQSDYRQQKVIITPVRYYKSIYAELSEFVPEEQILYLGEFLGGKL